MGLPCAKSTLNLPQGHKYREQVDLQSCEIYTVPGDIYAFHVLSNAALRKHKKHQTLHRLQTGFQFYGVKPSMSALDRHSAVDT